MITKKDQIGITQERYEKTKLEYLKYADIKKIDVGGGMIHGEINDFKQDTSKKIILAHTSKPIEKQNTSIGSSVSFGDIDVLIHDNINYDNIRASQYLQEYFINLDSSSMNDILNFPIKTFKPEEILLDEGSIAKFVYLIISGNITTKSNEKNQINNISSGAFIADISVLHNTKVSLTYKATSYIKALEIPSIMFQKIAKKYMQLDKLHQLQQFLSSTWLFRESAIHSVLKDLYDDIQQIEIKADEILHSSIEDGYIHIVYKGALRSTLANLELEEINEGNFIGENFVFKKPQLVSISAIINSLVYKIPIKAIKNIPSLQWKIYEKQTKRFTNLVNKLPKSNTQILLNETNKSNINQIDKLHQILIDSYNILLFTSKNGSKQEIYDSLEFVYVNAKYHFQVEESLLIQYNHPKFREHRKEHKSFLKLLQKLLEGLENTENIDINEISIWINSHFNKDKEMALFLISKDVF